MRWIFGAAGVITALFFAAGLTIAREWEAKSNARMQVVFATAYMTGAGAAQSIRIVNASGGGLSIMSFFGAFACSPNGNYFAYGAQDGLHVVRADGSDGRDVTLTATTHSLGGIRVSNEGRVYALELEDYHLAGIVEEENETPRSPMQLPLDTAYFTWQADARRLAFSASSTGHIYVVNSDGSHLVEISDKGRLPAWSPDGSAILYSSGDGFAHIADVNALLSVRLIWANGFGSSWSPDGSRVAIVRDGDIHTIDLPSQHDRQLTTDSGAAINMTPCFLNARPLSLVRP